MSPSVQDRALDAPWDPVETRAVSHEDEQLANILESTKTMRRIADDSASEVSAISDDDSEDDDNRNHDADADASLFKKASTNTSVTSLNTTDDCTANPSPKRKQRSTIIEIGDDLLDAQTVATQFSSIDQVEGDMSDLKLMMTALLQKQNIDPATITMKKKDTNDVSDTHMEEADAPSTLEQTREAPRESDGTSGPATDWRDPSKSPTKRSATCLRLLGCCTAWGT